MAESPIFLIPISPVPGKGNFRATKADNQYLNFKAPVQV